MMQMLKTSLLTITLISLLSACGWHLRGQANIPPALRILHVEMSAADFTTQKLLTNALKNNNVTLTEDAEYQLRIVSVDSDKRTLSVSSSAKASEYELIETLVFNMRNAEGQAVTADMEIKSYRTQQYDADASAGEAQEEAQMRRELKRDNVNKLMYKLQALRIDQFKVQQSEAQDAP